MGLEVESGLDWKAEPEPDTTAITVLRPGELKASRAAMLDKIQELCQPLVQCDLIRELIEDRVRER